MIPSVVFQSIEMFLQQFGAVLAQCPLHLIAIDASFTVFETACSVLQSLCSRDQVGPCGFGLVVRVLQFFHILIVFGL